MGNGFTDHLKAKGLETITKQNETQLVTYSGQHHASSSGPRCSFVPRRCGGSVRAYTVKGNAIKCFRSLDYELQIALSGF